MGQKGIWIARLFRERHGEALGGHPSHCRSPQNSAHYREQRPAGLPPRCRFHCTSGHHPLERLAPDHPQHGFRQKATQTAPTFPSELEGLDAARYRGEGASSYVGIERKALVLLIRGFPQFGAV